MNVKAGVRDRIVLVVGAERGIGLACARAFADAGATVALADLPGTDIDRAAASLAGPGHTGHRIDLVDAPGSTEALFAESVAAHGRLDVLVSAAGTLSPGPFVDMSFADWQRTIAVNATGNVMLAQAAARHFLSRGRGGRIILFASIIGRHVVRLNNTAYCASKAALIQAARCMALELAPHGITVNTISPGSTATEMLVDVQAGGDASVLEGVVRGDAAQWRLGIPIGRLAEPADQAALAVFLATEDARHITGQDLAVDGGQTLV